ncbi:hypothetical protein ACHAQH_005335 [Verticillium albo-atrum]
MPPKRKKSSSADNEELGSSIPAEPNTKRKRSAPKKDPVNDPSPRKNDHYAAMLALDHTCPLEMPPGDARNLALRGSTSAASKMWRVYRTELKKLKKLKRKAERRKARKAQRQADTMEAAKLQLKEAKERAREEKKAEKHASKEQRDAIREEVRTARAAERATREELKAALQQQREARRRTVGERVPVVKRPVPESARAESSESEEYDEEAAFELIDGTGGCRLLNAPYEIREMILENLLTTDKPIRLIEGWARLWKGRGPHLDTAIMRTCKQIFGESVGIIYGCNTFEYVLRDIASNPPPEDVEASESGDGMNDDIEELEQDFEDGVQSDGGSEYTDDEDELDEDGDEVPSRPSVRNPNPSVAPSSTRAVDIDIQKFGSLFRHLTIVTERNRTERGYLHSMADAIDAFRQLSDPGAHIHTLSIVVNPSRDGDKVTFLDFFEPGGRIVEALRGLACQFVRFVVNTDRSARGERLPHVVELDMQPLEAEKDEDELKRQRRAWKLEKRQTILQTLPQLIQGGWEAGADPDDEEEDWDMH